MEPGVGKWVSYLNREKKLDSLVGTRPSAPPAPKGLYIYGNVGSGMSLNIFLFTSKANFGYRNLASNFLFVSLL